MKVVFKTMVHSSSNIELTAQVLKLLGDKTRLTILKILDEGSCCVSEFVEILEISQPAISQHLRKLKDVGLVEEERKGQWISYSINREVEQYRLVQQILLELPSQKEKLEYLIKQGKRIVL